MTNYNNDQFLNILIYILIGMCVILFALMTIFIIIKLKNRTTVKNNEKSKSTTENTQKSSTSYSQYGKQSIFNFMEFNEVKDNMIIQKNGERFLMVVGCQGVNYDLMSGVEKSAVEDGFVQFLNTLRHPIQIYIQTRSVNLKGSINTYKERLDDIKKELDNMKKRYEDMQEAGNYSKNEIEKLYYEITKQTNLYEYGKDVIYNTEKMSTNKSISAKQYYIIVPYYASELGSNQFDKAEIENLSFSELYTRCQSIIRTLGVCGVNGKILNSIELAELLYIAYNRDEAEVFEISRALEAGCDEMYSTAPEVLDKRMKTLDKKIHDEAMLKAQTTVDEVQDEKRMEIMRKEKSMDELIDDLAMSIIEENREYLGDDIVDEAKNKISKNSKKEGGKADEKKKTTTRKS